LLAVPGLALAGEKQLGTVDDVDVGTAEVTLENGKVLEVPSEVTIYRNESEVALDALEEGDSIRASYDSDGALSMLTVTSADEADPSAEGWDAPRDR
jgi:hypothetical protein